MGENDEYGVRKPASGRSAVDPRKLGRVKTGERAAVPPAPARDPVSTLIIKLEDLKLALQESSGQLTPEQSSAVKKWDRFQKIGAGVKIAMALTVLIFGAGVSYAIWVTAFATDADVHSAVDAAITEHNGGYDPNALNGDGQPVGDHPDMRKAIKQNSETIRAVTEAVGDIQDELPKIDMRGEYQFEFSRWQAAVTECERKRCKYPPPKPERLTELERKLLFGNYGESKRKFTGDQ